MRASYRFLPRRSWTGRTCCSHTGMHARYYLNFAKIGALPQPGGKDGCHEMLLTRFSVPVRLRSKFHKFTIAWTAKYGYNQNLRRSWFVWYKPIKSFSSLKASHVRTRSLAGFKGKDQGGNATKRSSMNILSADSAPRVHFLKRNLG